LIAECVAVGKQMMLQRRLHSPESVSTELFTSALKLADNYGLLETVPDDEPATPGAESTRLRTELARRRIEFAERLRAIGARIAQAAALDPSNLEAR
jgi:glycerol-3-phosphate O-acyltransferase